MYNYVHSTLRALALLISMVSRYILNCGDDQYIYRGRSTFDNIFEIIPYIDLSPQNIIPVLPMGDDVSLLFEYLNIYKFSTPVALST